MSVVQNPYAVCGPDGRLAFTWELAGGLVAGSSDAPVAFSVQVAADPEFLVTPRTFVVPGKVTSVQLDTGAGRWFYRVGGWIGTAQKGVVSWSGIYGPVVVAGGKAVVPTKPAAVNIHHIQGALDSMIMHTGVHQPYYVVVDYTHEPTLSASTAKTVYMHDWGKGSFQVFELQPQRNYTFRVSSFIDKKESLPTSTIKQLGEGVYIRNKKVARPVAASSSGDIATFAADKVILKEAAEKQSLRFSSYADYMQYIAAKARTTERPV
jgi:hypothetical protein